MAAELLFSSTDLRSYLEQRKQYLQQEVEQADEAYLLGTDPREWAAFLGEKHQLRVPELRVDDMVVDAA